MNLQLGAEIAALPSIQALPHRKQFFCLGYIAHQNGAKAVEDAGYKIGIGRSQASTQAGRLLRNADVALAVREGLALKWQAGVMSASEVLTRLSRISQHDHRKVMRAAVLDTTLQNLDDDTAEAVQGVKIRKEFDKHGAVKAETTEYKIASKVSALELMARYHRLLQMDTTAADFGSAFADAMDRAQNRSRLRDAAAGATDAIITPAANAASDSSSGSGDAFAKGAA